MTPDENMGRAAQDALDELNLKGWILESVVPSPVPYHVALHFQTNKHQYVIIAMELNAPRGLTGEIVRLLKIRAGAHG